METRGERRSSRLKDKFARKAERDEEQETAAAGGGRTTSVCHDGKVEVEHAAKIPRLEVSPRKNGRRTPSATGGPASAGEGDHSSSHIQKGKGKPSGTGGPASAQGAAHTRKNEKGKPSGTGGVASASGAAHTRKEKGKPSATEGPASGGASHTIKGKGKPSTTGGPASASGAAHTRKGKGKPSSTAGDPASSADEAQEGSSHIRDEGKGTPSAPGTPAPSGGGVGAGQEDMPEEDQLREMQEITEANLFGDGGRVELLGQQLERVQNRLRRILAADGYLCKDTAQLFKAQLVGGGVTAEGAGQCVLAAVFYTTGVHLERDLDISFRRDAVKACLRRHGLHEQCFPGRDEDEDDDDYYDGVYARPSNCLHSPLACFFLFYGVPHVPTAVLRSICLTSPFFFYGVYTRYI